MEERRYFWLFDHKLFEQIEMPEFTLLEGVLIVLSLIALGLYVMLIVFLDTRGRLRAKRTKQRAWIKRWLEHARLSPRELATLDVLAEGSAPLKRYGVLSDPVQFETRVHDGISAGEDGVMEFAKKMRPKLGYTSESLRTPVISTRQLVPGDPLRITFWQSEMPNHFYGKILEIGADAFRVELRPEAVQLALVGGDMLDIFYIRGLGLEYLFSCKVAGRGRTAEQLVLRHAMTEDGRSPRRVRLPVLVEVMFRARSLDAEPEFELDASPVPQERGLLLDLSGGGFCMGHNREIPPGHYIEFRLPLRKGKAALHLIGRVRDCRPFSGNQWLSRCELRGLDSGQRDMLGQVLRLEQQNRFKVLAPVRRRAAKAG